METENKTEAIFAIVEQNGHRRFGARVTNTLLAGVPMLNCEVVGDKPFTTVVAPGSLFAMTPCSEAAARLANEHGWRPMEMLRALPAGSPVWDGKPCEAGCGVIMRGAVIALRGHYYCSDACSDMGPEQRADHGGGMAGHDEDTDAEVEDPMAGYADSAIRQASEDGDDDEEPDDDLDEEDDEDGEGDEEEEARMLEAEPLPLEFGGVTLIANPEANADYRLRWIDRKAEAIIRNGDRMFALTAPMRSAEMEPDEVRARVASRLIALSQEIAAHVGVTVEFTRESGSRASPGVFTHAPPVENDWAVLIVPAAHQGQHDDAGNAYPGLVYAYGGNAPREALRAEGISDCCIQGCDLEIPGTGALPPGIWHWQGDLRNGWGWWTRSTLNLADIVRRGETLQDAPRLTVNRELSSPPGSTGGTVVLDMKEPAGPDILDTMTGIRRELESEGVAIDPWTVPSTLWDEPRGTVSVEDYRIDEKGIEFGHLRLRAAPGKVVNLKVKADEELVGARFERPEPEDTADGFNIFLLEADDMPTLVKRVRASAGELRERVGLIVTWAWPAGDDHPAAHLQLDYADLAKLQRGDKVEARLASSLAPLIVVTADRPTADDLEPTHPDPFMALALEALEVRDSPDPREGKDLFLVAGRKSMPISWGIGESAGAADRLREEVAPVLAELLRGPPAFEAAMTSTERRMIAEALGLAPNASGGEVLYRIEGCRAAAGEIDGTASMVLKLRRAIKEALEIHDRLAPQKGYAPAEIPTENDTQILTIIIPLLAEAIGIHRGRALYAPEPDINDAAWGMPRGEPDLDTGAPTEEEIEAHRAFLRGRNLILMAGISTPNTAVFVETDANIGPRSTWRIVAKRDISGVECSAERTVTPAAIRSTEQPDEALVNALREALADLDEQEKNPVRVEPILRVGHEDGGESVTFQRKPVFTAAPTGGRRPFLIGKAEPQEHDPAGLMPGADPEADARMEKLDRQRRSGWRAARPGAHAQPSLAPDRTSEFCAVRRARAGVSS